MSKQNKRSNSQVRPKFNSSLNAKSIRRQADSSPLNKSSSNSSNKKSPFSSLHQRGKKLLRINPATSALLMTLADNQHKTIAELMKKWIKETNTQ